MHTTKLESGTLAHHNGDYSGDVFLVIPADRAEMELDHQAKTVSVRVPFDDLMELVSYYVRDRYISALEDAVPRDVLLNAVDPSKW